MKLYYRFRLLVLAILLLSTGTVSAIQGHPYIGAQLGVGQVDLNDMKDKVELIGEFAVAETSSDKNGFAGRIYAGYQFIPYLGVEVGYAKYPDSKSEVNDFSEPLATLEFSAVNRVSTFDALVVGTLPLFDKLSLNAKAGGAYVMNDYRSDTSFNGVVRETLTVKARTFRPKFAVGADYYLTDSVALGLAYEITLRSEMPSDINTDEGNADFSPKISMASVNVKYHF